MQTTENTLKQENSPPTENKNIDLRIPKIIELRLKGHTWGEIANQINRDVRTFYDIRKTEDFQLYCNTLIPIYDKTLKELLHSEQQHIRLGASLELGRMIRSIIPKQIHQRTQKEEIKIILHEFKPSPNKE